MSSNSISKSGSYSRALRGSKAGAEAPCFLTKRQFADLLQVTERTVDRWFQDGELPEEIRLTIGGCVRFMPTALERWINSQAKSKR
ncbi:helix-turn-helix domain-containing protein [Rhodopirellula sp.]|nr:helix-turn-helix domain-containing protein [Rhodopirellula sp.]